MNPEDFALILRGHERSGVEFKPACLREGDLLGEVVKAILGMANFRGGGYVLLGVEENDDRTPRPVGLSPEQLRSWNFDDTSARVAAHADPFVTFTREEHTYSGLQILVFHVSEFAMIPVLCKRAYQHSQRRGPILREGACYVRTRSKPETTEIASQTEMRELLDLAIDKGLREFIRRAVAAGALIGGPASATPTDDEMFARELEDLK